VRIVCTRCDRAGQYPKAKLIERYGANIAASDVLAEISQCPRRQTLGTACEAVFIDLAKVNNENMPIPMSS
jgi:hypothetical protein